MGVYIKGMEMPISCARCRCARGCPAINDRVVRMDEHPWFPHDHRHEDCPLGTVVLCRDCKYYYKDTDGYEMCDNSEGHDHVMEDGFCAWAVKREES